MQGHFEGTQPSPYASISVNNPSRFTNSNLVNRRHMEQQQQEGQDAPMPIKPVIPRRRTANNSNNSSNNQAAAQQSQIIQPSTSTILTQLPIAQDPSQDNILRSPSPSHHISIQTTGNTLTQDIKPNIQTLNMPQHYNGSTMPQLVTTNMPGNVEIFMTFNQGLH